MSRPTLRFAWRLSSALLAGVLLSYGLGNARAEEEEEKEERKREIILRTEYDDKDAGKQGSEEVRAEVGLVDDPELVEYVQAIGQRLARNAPRGRFDYSFQVVDQDAPNAFALPGGFIYISRGLLALANSEDELANVIGHEIIHVAARHAAARQHLVRGTPKLFQWLQMGQFARYGRNQEREADRLGQGLAGLAGYDPEGMATFLKDLEFTERLRLGSSRLPGFLDTHPVTRERTASAAARAGRITWKKKPGIAKSREEYLRRIDGLTLGTSASEGVFKGSRFVHPELGFTMRFPDGWELHNTRRAVGAVSPKKDAQVFLEFHGEGKDPEAAANEHLEKFASQGLEADRVAAIKLGGYAGYRVHARARGNKVLLTFVAAGTSYIASPGWSEAGMVITRVSSSAWRAASVPPRGGSCAA